jgi:hypothetical protein
MKLEIVILVLIIFLSFSSVSYADVIQPGMKDVKIYYQINNIQNYPDYVFLIRGTPSPSLEIINSSEFTFYKLSTVSIYAVSKRSFNENELKNMDDTQLGNFLNSSNVIKSNIKLQGSSKNINIDNPLEKILLTLNINSIDNNTMNITKSKITYIYNDGSTGEETFKDQNSTPEPSKNDTSFWANNLFFIILPLLAIIALAGIIIKRSK